ncbi:MAG: alpha/beta hydrolase [Deltaproteobacteria bacterium]|nr:alpha/beta hydrolase [Deltaproteobacteria bacterium]
MNKILEDCFFFYNQQGHYLYGCSYIPRSDMSETGIVIVPPVGHERLRCYRECVTLARELAEAGYFVFRFDYRGEGESFGEFPDFDVKTRLEDINSALKEFSRRFLVHEIVLVGFRLGALFTLKAAKANAIKRIILCEPVYNVKKYVKNCIRSNIIAQRDYFGKSSIKEDVIWDQLNKGESISVYGFQMSLPFLRQLQEFDISSELKAFHNIALVIYFYKNKKPAALSRQLTEWCEYLDENAIYDVEPVKTRFSWTTKKIWTPILFDLNNCIIKWIKINGS